jgi:hypothetical protein
MQSFFLIQRNISDAHKKVNISLQLALWYVEENCGKLFAWVEEKIQNIQG